MKYKVGDMVRVRSDLEVGEEYGRQFFVHSMEWLKGATLTIKKTYDNSYAVKESTYIITDEMIEPVEELSAEEAIKQLGDLCSHFPACTACPVGAINNEMACNMRKKTYPGEVLKVLKLWKAEHEKKSIETEFINVVRVIENTGTMKKCVYEERLPEGELNLSEKQSEVLRKYCEEHKGKYFAVVERICAVKE